METIGGRIRSIRRDHKLTQAEFANELCVSRPHITNVENDKENPSKLMIRLISILFKVDEQWIITGN